MLLEQEMKSKIRFELPQFYLSQNLGKQEQIKTLLGQEFTFGHNLRLKR